jgi:SnoaL-like domain
VKIKGTSRDYSCFFVGVSLLLVGFGSGWETSRRLMISASGETQLSYLQARGNAPSPLRGEVLNSLREFQDGYRKRDPHQLNSFMQSLFPSDQDTRIIGTNTDEWSTGYDSVAQFIREDWLAWGNVRLNVDDAVVSSSGDTAWLATTGKVDIPGHSPRSLRLTAVLTRKDSRWLFRQIQFQWDERYMRLSDVLSQQGWLQLNLR